MRACTQAFILMALVVTGCTNDRAATPATGSTSGSEVDHQEVEPRATERTPAPLVVATPVHSCIRAYDCCMGYLHSMMSISPALADSMDPETVCAGVLQAAEAGLEAEAGCKAAIDGWRAGLATMDVPMPDACR